MLKFILLHNVLEFLPCVRQDNHSSGDLFLQLVQLLISLFNLFIQGLVFDFKLLEVDQVKTISQLLLLFVDLVQVVVAVPQRNILETVLVDLLIFDSLVDFPLFNHRLLQFLSSPGENSILGH